MLMLFSMTEEGDDSILTQWWWYAFYLFKTSTDLWKMQGCFKELRDSMQYPAWIFHIYRELQISKANGFQKNKIVQFCIQKGISTEPEWNIKCASIRSRYKHLHAVTFSLAQATQLADKSCISKWGDHID